MLVQGDGGGIVGNVFFQLGIKRARNRAARFGGFLVAAFHVGQQHAQQGFVVVGQALFAQINAPELAGKIVAGFGFVQRIGVARRFKQTVLGSNFVRFARGCPRTFVGIFVQQVQTPHGLDFVIAVGGYIVADAGKRVYAVAAVGNVQVAVAQFQIQEQVAGDVLVCRINTQKQQCNRHIVG